MALRSPVPTSSALEDRLAHAPDLVLGYVVEAAEADRLDGGEDAPHEIGPARPHVLVGGVDQRLEGHAQRGLPGHIPAPELLERVAGVLGPRALRVVVRLLVATAGDVILEEPAEPGLLVEACEDRDDDKPLERRGQVHPYHLAQLVGLAVEREVVALDLLVVLQLRLEELGHLHGGAGGAGDADAREVVGLEDLLHPAARDLKARRRLTVARHDHALAVPEGEDGRAVGHGHRAVDARREAREQVRRVTLEELHEARRGVVDERALPAAGRRIVRGTSKAHIPPLGREMFLRRSAAVGDSVRSCRTCASVPRSGSSMKIFLRGPSFRSKITESQLADTISSA